MGLREGLLKDKFTFFEAYKSPIPKMRKLLAKRPILQAQRALFSTPSKLDRVTFSDAPRPKPTIKQLKEARKGNGSVKGTDPPVTRTERPFNCRKRL